MNHTNIEIKAKSSGQHQNFVREKLRDLNAVYRGTDYQVDTYFKVEEGRRLKIRKGNIENTLIDYERPNKKDSKDSKVKLFHLNGSENLEKITRETHEVLIEVHKKREIYFIENVKFHIDKVKELGRFIEIEAISENNKIPKEKLLEQCNYYKNLFNIKENDLISVSYSDLLLEKNKNALD